MQIGVASLADADTRALLSLHQRRMYDASPPGTSFALDLSGLEHPEISIFEARKASRLLGVGALKDMGAGSGEIKAMRIADDALCTGVGQALLDHIVGVAQDRKYARLLLETGTGDAFAAASRLYLRNGFTRREPFGNYNATAFNIFYELVL